MEENWVFPAEPRGHTLETNVPSLKRRVQVGRLLCETCANVCKKQKEQVGHSFCSMCANVCKERREQVGHSLCETCADVCMNRQMQMGHSLRVQALLSDVHESKITGCLQDGGNGLRAWLLLLLDTLQTNDQDTPVDAEFSEGHFDLVSMTVCDHFFVTYMSECHCSGVFFI